MTRNTHLLDTKNPHFINARVGLNDLEIHRYRLLLGLEPFIKGQDEECPFEDVYCDCSEYKCKYFNEKTGCLLGFPEGGVDYSQEIEKNSKQH